MPSPAGGSSARPLNRARLFARRIEAEALFPDLKESDAPHLTPGERRRARAYLASREAAGRPRREEPYACGLGWVRWMA